MDNIAEDIDRSQHYQRVLCVVCEIYDTQRVFSVADVLCSGYANTRWDAECTVYETQRLTFHVRLFLPHSASILCAAPVSAKCTL